MLVWSKWLKKNQSGSFEKVMVSGEEMQEVDKFNYVGVIISRGCRMRDLVAHRVPEGRKLWGPRT